MPIAIRSPYFVSGTGGKSYQIKVTIDGTLRYTIFKNYDGNVGFEISELIRDYLNIAYSGTLPSNPSAAFLISVKVFMDIWSTFDGTGTGDVSSSEILDTDAIDAYGYFSDGYNYSTPNVNAAYLSGNTIWAPENTAGAFYYTDSSSNFYRRSYSNSSTSETGTGWTITIKRFPCSKYNAIKVVFVNRFGVLQELYFFNKTIESVSSTSEQYKSSNVPYDGDYNIYEHQFKNFDKQGKTRYRISSGYVDESYNNYIQEMMLSEQVWMHIDSQIRPINVITSDATFKTSLNDKLVEYTIEFEQANDLISSMR
jgi:hypothetical protein